MLNKQSNAFLKEQIQQYLLSNFIIFIESGQTGAGKTYTIVGNCPEINSES